MKSVLLLLPLCVFGAIVAASPTVSRALPVAQGPSTAPPLSTATTEDPVDLGFGGCMSTQSPWEVHAEFLAAVRRGEIPDPAARPRPLAGPSHRGTKALGSGPLTHDDIWAWEDTNGQIKATFPPTFGLPDPVALNAILVEAANDFLATHCDDYDFIAFWMNYPPADWWEFGNVLGANSPIKSETTGLGVMPPEVVIGVAPDGTYDFHETYGLAGSKVQALLFFTNLNDPLVDVNDKIRLMVAHEYAHRWGMHLPPLLDGRTLQGEGGPAGPDPCGGLNHWNWRVDGQGSSFALRDWIGSSPAVSVPGPSFNTDIPGGVYSYLELYLMGLVSPAEVTAGMSELRYMDGSVDCTSPFSGPISDFTIDDIIAAAGPRVPDSTASQKGFRTAWVIIHQPGDAPDAAEKDKLIAILEQQELDWSYGTLGKSTMSHKVDPAVQAIETVRLGTPPNPAALLPGQTSGPVVGATWDPVIDHASFLPLALQDFLAIGLVPTDISTGFGTLLCGVAPPIVLLAAPGAPFLAPIPSDCSHVGQTLCAQGAGIDAAFSIALTNALDITIGTY